jgi:hypothetical protein
MSAKELIDGIRAALEAEGFQMKMAIGRDQIARVCYGVAYSPAIAAERAGTLTQPQIVEASLADLSARFGADKAALVRKVVADQTQSKEKVGTGSRQ